MVNRIQLVRLTSGRTAAQTNLDARLRILFHSHSMVYLNELYSIIFTRGIDPVCLDYILDLCSHRRSVQFYAESVNSTDPTTFLATTARSWSRFQAGATNRIQTANMGLNCPTNVHGDYYLQTNSIGPFSRGANGMRYLN